MDMIVQKRRGAEPASQLLRRLLKDQHFKPEAIVGEGLQSCGGCNRAISIFTWRPLG